MSFQKEFASSVVYIHLSVCLFLTFMSSPDVGHAFGLAAKSAEILINGGAELNKQEAQYFRPFICEVVRLSTAAALGQNYTLPMLAKSAERVPIANLTISHNPAVGRSTIGMALAMSGFMPMAVSGSRGIQSLLHRVQEKIKQEDETSWESPERGAPC